MSAQISDRPVFKRTKKEGNIASLDDFFDVDIQVQQVCYSPINLQRAVQFLLSMTRSQTPGTITSKKTLNKLVHLFNYQSRECYKPNKEEVRVLLQTAWIGCEVLILLRPDMIVGTSEGQAFLKSLAIFCHQLFRVVELQNPLEIKDCMTDFSRGVIVLIKFHVQSQSVNHGIKLRSAKLFLVLLKTMVRFLGKDGHERVKSFLFSQLKALPPTSPFLRLIHASLASVEQDFNLEMIDTKCGRYDMETEFHISCMVQTCPVSVRFQILDRLLDKLSARASQTDSTTMCCQIFTILNDSTVYLNSVQLERCIKALKGITSAPQLNFSILEFFGGACKGRVDLGFLEESCCKTLWLWGSDIAFRVSPRRRMQEDAVNLTLSLMSFALERNFEFCRSDGYFSCLQRAFLLNIPDVIHKSICITCSLHDHPVVRDYMLTNHTELLASLASSLSYPQVAQRHGTKMAVVFMDAAQHHRASRFLACQHEVREAFIILARSGPRGFRIDPTSCEVLAILVLLTLSSNPLNRPLLAHHPGVLKTLMHSLRTQAGGTSEFLTAVERDKLRCNVLAMMQVV